MSRLICFRMMASLLAIGFILTVNSVSFVSATAYNNVSQRLLKISSMYCPFNHICGVSASNANEERQNTSCCIECSCAEDCLKYGNCCPYKENISNKISVLQCKETVTKKKIFEREFYDDAIFADYRIIDNCPTGENNITLVQMCKGEIKNALEDYVWVSDQRTGEIYQNKHCAICNGIEAYTPWRIRTTYRRLMLAETTNEIETILLSDVCDIINEPPDGEQVRAELYRCYIPEYQQCNMTGQWLKYDRDIDNACKQIDWLYFDFTLVLARVYGPEVYKNIFCYICNKDINLLHANETCPEDKALLRSGYETVFTALIDFEQYWGVQSTRDTVSECAVNEVLDIYTVCTGAVKPVLSGHLK